jgi:hypothetical protein
VNRLCVIGKVTGWKARVGQMIQGTKIIPLLKITAVTKTMTISAGTIVKSFIGKLYRCAEIESVQNCTIPSPCGFRHPSYRWNALPELAQFSSRACIAENLRSICASERGPPELSTQHFPTGAPQVGQATEYFCLVVSSLLFILIVCDYTQPGGSSVLDIARAVVA